MARNNQNRHRDSPLNPQPALLDMDSVRELALALGPTLNGQDISLVQAALVLSWLMTTGALNTIPGQEERVQRASIFIPKATEALARLVGEVISMTAMEIEEWQRRHGNPGLAH